ncbi:MAG: response regulator [Planctomycetota bacterium]|nr:MAG: response regulator [Planctomycetota bacterium]
MKRFDVLLASSEPQTLTRLRQLLSCRNDRYVEAPLGPSCLEHIEQGPVDAVILAPTHRETDIAACREAYERAEQRGMRTIVVGDDEIQQAVGGDRRLLRAGLETDALLAALDRATRHLLTILVADDEPHIRQLFARYLGTEGYKVVTAEDGEKAATLVRQVLPDLVITDIKMPRMDGYALCRTIKESWETQHIPVMIVSALGGELDIDKAFNAGANEYLTKPVVLQEAASRIQAIFRGIAMRGRERVLVVAPSQIERSLLEYGLSQQGFEVEVARDANEAAQLLHEQPPGLVVCDREPEGCGIFELRERMRAHQHTRDVPLVVLTSRASNINHRQRRELDAAAYITKPYPIERLVANIERILGERRSRLELEREMLLQTITSLVTALEARDVYTRGHSENVAEYAVMIARRLPEAFPNEESIARLHLAGKLHDVGKIGVPDAVLLKPGKLDDAEWALMKQHPVTGYEILAPIPSLQDILPGVRWHHERIDGNGYPDGLSGEDIPLMARIIAVADTFDALTSTRPYRNPFTVEKAVAILQEVRGTQLDAQLVDIFVEAIEHNRLAIPARSTTP